MKPVPILILCLLSLAFAQETDSAAKLAKQAFEARNAGQLDQSIELYRLALTLRPEDPESWFYLGLNYYDQDKYPDCEEAFGHVTEQAPENSAGFAFQGLCEFQTKKYESAFSYLVLAQHKGLPAGGELAAVVTYHYVMLANKIGQFELANSLLADIARNPQVDVPQLVEMTGLSALRMALLPAEIPADQAEPVQMAGRATILAWRRRLPEALAEANALLQKYPKQANAHYLKGYILILQHSDASITEFEKELEISPNHVQARLQIGHEYLQRGEAEKGLPYAGEAVQMDPTNFTAHDIYGRLLLDAGKVAPAIAHLETAVKLAPARPEVHFHLATALARAGRTEEAAEQRKLFQKLDQARRKQRPTTLGGQPSR